MLPCGRSWVGLSIRPFTPAVKVGMNSRNLLYPQPSMRLDEHTERAIKAKSSVERSRELKKSLKGNYLGFCYPLESLYKVLKKSVSCEFILPSYLLFLPFGCDFYRTEKKVLSWCMSGELFVYETPEIGHRQLWRPGLLQN